MYTTAIRRVGGSTMLALPKAFLEQLRIKVGSKVAVEVDHGRIVIEPATKPKYKLEELLAQCDTTAAMSAEDAEWLNSGPAGGELI
jgi:antitoxin ChpS